jgi:hypothetical protein
MADIFLSYASADRPRAQQLAAALQAEGWTVWWDRNIHHGLDFNETIQRELDASKCIVVLWSATSLRSPFVRDEATEGLNGRLVPVTIENVKPPLGFRQLQAADLSEWVRKGSSQEFARFIESIRTLLAAGSVTPRSTVTRQDSRLRRLERLVTRNRKRILVALASTAVILAVLWMPRSAEAPRVRSQLQPVTTCTDKRPPGREHEYSIWVGDFATAEDTKSICSAIQNAGMTPYLEVSSSFVGVRAGFFQTSDAMDDARRTLRFSGVKVQ